MPEIMETTNRKPAVQAAGSRSESGLQTTDLAENNSINSKRVTNQEFITAAFPAGFPGVRLVAGVDTDPNNADKKEWRARIVNGVLPVSANQNTYYACATVNHGTSRRTDNFCAGGVLVIDDVISKRDPEEITLGPSYKFETSMDNEQWGYFLDGPVDKETFKALQKALSAGGGADKNGNNIVRYARLPEGINNKQSVVDDYGDAFPVTVSEWHPERRYSVEELIKGLGLDVQHKATQEAVSTPAAPEHQADGLSPVDQIKIRNLALHLADETNLDPSVGRHNQIYKMGNFMRRDKLPGTPDALEFALKIFEQNMRQCDTSGVMSAMNWEKERQTIADGYHKPSEPDSVPDIDLPPLNFLPQTQIDDVLSQLQNLCVTKRLTEMKTNLENDYYVIDGMALDGQITLFYAKPNTGKTLLFFYFIIDAIKRDVLNPEDIFYINADDNYKGLVTKAEIAQEYGFHMISPQESNLKASDIVKMLEQLAASGDAKGKIIFLDTLKKFTDLMSKQVQKGFFDCLRLLTAKNATVIIAGHANKYEDSDGNIVYEGTGDTHSDIDCMYAVQVIAARDGLKTVQFTNKKMRGDNIESITYSYEKRDGMNYREIIDTITKVDDAQIDDARSMAKSRKYLEMYEAERVFVTGLLKDGKKNQSHIMSTFTDASREEDHELHKICGEISNRSLKDALKKLDGVAWATERDKAHGNALFFKLFFGSAFFEEK